MSENHGEKFLLASVLTYLFAAAAIYLELRGLTDCLPVEEGQSTGNIFWLLVAIGLLIGVVREIALLANYRKFFMNIERDEIKKSDLLKILGNFVLAVIFSYGIYLFVASEDPDLSDPLAFIAIAGFVYIGTSALSRYTRYIPVLLTFFRRDHGGE